jgi:hypothetical protein
MFASLLRTMSARQDEQGRREIQDEEIEEFNFLQRF